jgi:cytolysin-activating lysine-acyltransferase
MNLDCAITPPAMTPELMAQIAGLRSKIQISIGQTILAIMDLPRYKHMSLADFSHLIINPLLRNRVAIAHKSITENGTSKVDEETIAGIAIWASVSPAVDAKITEQTKAGVFPIRLAPEDWISGDLPWLLDVIAGDRQQATAVLANFRQVVGEKPIKIHPIVARLIDPAVLEKLKLASAAEEKSALTNMPDTKGNA